jgi:septal ring factor EnvC (AmiA/AmiB activator)
MIGFRKILVLAALVPIALEAAPATSGKSAAELQKALQQERAASAQLGAKETSLLGKLADLERQVELESRALKAATTRLRQSQTRLAGAEQKVLAAQAEVDTASRALGPRLTARYQLGREGYVRFLLGSRSIGDLLRRKRLYSALLEADLDALAVLRFKVLGAQAAKDELQAARDELASAASTEQEKRSALEVKASVQKKALASIQQEKGLHEQAARELEQASKALSEKVRELEEAKKNAPPPPPAQTALSANNRDANDPRLSPASSARTTASEPPGKKVAMLAPPMRSQKGKLQFPVDSGRVEARFGRTLDPRFGTVTLQRGLDIRGPGAGSEGADVHAIYTGTVVHAGWFSGYGNLVILDHGDGMFSLFAHLATLTRAVGDVVEKGEPIGTVGDTGSLKGPYLYFELRDGQKPIDPEKWLTRAKAAPHK